VLLMEYQAGMNEELYQDSKECLEYFPTISTVYLLNGVSANQLKKYDEAIDVLSTGIELIVNDEPMKAEFEGQIGDAYFGLSSFEKAKETYRSAIKRSPQSNLLKNNLAYKLAVNKLDLELAESLIKRVLKNSDQANYYDTYGVVLFHKGEFEKAEKQFNTAYKKTPQDALVLEHLGDVSYKLGNTESALKFWEKAKDLGRVNDVLEKKINTGKYHEK
jgi:tetratricopeptide (TPR) repeat protein